MMAETDPIMFLYGIAKGLPMIYQKLGFESKESIKLRQIVDVVVSRCNSAIKEENDIYLQGMREKLMYRQ